MSLFVTKVLERGADPTQTTAELDTALHLAAAKGMTSVAKQLVEFGAILEARNSKQEIPLELAIKKKQNSVATFLVKSMRPAKYVCITYIYVQYLHATYLCMLPTVRAPIYVSSTYCTYCSFCTYCYYCTCCTYILLINI